MTFTLEALPYAYDALQPYLSKESFEYHHDKHHATYVANANNLIKGTEFEGKPIEEIIVSSHGKNVPIFNNVAQHYNHHHYWHWLKPNGGGAIPGKVEKASSTPRLGRQVQGRVPGPGPRPVRLGLGLA